MEKMALLHYCHLLLSSVACFPGPIPSSSRNTCYARQLQLHKIPHQLRIQLLHSTYLARVHSAVDDESQGIKGVAAGDMVHTRNVLGQDPSAQNCSC